MGAGCWEVERDRAPRRRACDTCDLSLMPSRPRARVRALCARARKLCARSQRNRASQACRRRAELRGNIAAAVDRRVDKRVETVERRRAEIRAQERERATSAAAQRVLELAEHEHAALGREKRAEEQIRTLRAQLSRAKARASDAAALRRKNTELSALRAENTKLARDNYGLEKQLAAARADAAAARGEYGEVWVPHRPRCAGAGRGRPHDLKLRRMYQALLAEGLVHPAKLNTVTTIVAEAICLAKCKREMELPDDSFGLGLRTEMGAVHRMLAGRALESCERIASSQSDASSVDQHQFLVAPMRLDEPTADGGVQRRRWSPGGAVHIAHGSGKAEADAIKSMVFYRLVDSVATAHAVLVKKYGEKRAAEIIASRNGGVSVAKLAGGVSATDNASAALAAQRELHKLVALEVKKLMGDEEWKKLSAEEQKQLTKVWYVAHAPRTRRVMCLMIAVKSLDSRLHVRAPDRRAQEHDVHAPPREYIHRRRREVGEGVARRKAEGLARAASGGAAAVGRHHGAIPHACQRRRRRHRALRKGRGRQELPAVAEAAAAPAKSALPRARPRRQGRAPGPRASALSWSTRVVLASALSRAILYSRAWVGRCVRNGEARIAREFAGIIARFVVFCLGRAPRVLTIVTVDIVVDSSVDAPCAHQNPLSGALLGR